MYSIQISKNLKLLKLAMRLLVSIKFQVRIFLVLGRGQALSSAHSSVFPHIAKKLLGSI